MSDDGDNQIERFGPFSLSETDADGGVRLYISGDALAASGLDEDSAVVLQPYENGIHVIEAKEAVFDD